MKDYPDHYFVMVSRNLGCNACSETLSCKKSSIEKHVKSKKYLTRIFNIGKSIKESQSILECLQRRDKRDHASGSTLPEAMRVFRFEIVKCLFSGGIPLSKVDALRPILEKYGDRLTSSTNLSELIPALL